MPELLDHPLMSPPPAATERAFRGTFLHAPERGRLECLKDALIVVAADGAISAVCRAESAAARAAAHRLAPGGTLVTLGPKPLEVSDDGKV